MFDVVVVGAGIVGLATARRLLERRPGLRLAVVEKEAQVGFHQTGRNSGVIHRGVYYAPGSLKARLCLEGARLLTAFCDAHEIPYRLCGKVIVALHSAELPALDELERRGRANGVPGLRRIGRDELHELEPAVVGVAALHSPETGIVDFTRVAAALADEVRSRGGEIRLSTAVRRLSERRDDVQVETDAGELSTRAVIAAAGLHADRLAQMTDPDAARAMRIVPFRGDYHRLRPERVGVARGLIYPVPDPRFLFLGVHLTPTMDGSVLAGPNAVLAFAAEGYRLRDIRLRELARTLTFPGFWRLARRYWRTGAAEMWRDVSRHAFGAALRRYVPEIRDDDLLPARSGVRAQALARDGRLVDDFAFTTSRRTIHVRNAPSPAATSSLAIADYIAERAEEAFGLAAA